MKTIVKYLYIVCGSLFMAIAINMFIAGNALAFGGVSGIGVIGYNLLDIPLSATNLIINIPLFLLGVKYIGKGFFINSLFATGMVSAFVSLTSPLLSLEVDLILAAIFGGLLMGMGVGIVIKAGGSTGGTDMVALILNKKLHIPLSASIFMIDSGVILLGAYLFGMNNALYSVIVVFCLSKAVGLTIKYFDGITNHVTTYLSKRKKR